jgi:hypothetical protein
MCATPLMRLSFGHGLMDMTRIRTDEPAASPALPQVP